MPALVSRRQVARLRLKRAGLLSAEGGGVPCGDASQVMRRLGQVQVDPMNVVARSAHIVMWSRCPAYRQADLDGLYANGPQVFEYWTRVAALLSMDLYPLVAPTMPRTRRDSWWERWVANFEEGHTDVIDSVLAEIEARGPLASRDFPTDREHRGRWNSRKTAKDALEALWHRGEVVVRERRRGEKVFDLTSRVLPKEIEPLDVAEPERLLGLWRAALGQLGACTTGELAGFYGAVGWPPDGKLSATEVLDAAREAGLHTFRVRAFDADWVCLPEDEGRLHEPIEPVPPRMTFLSPFDSIVNNRWILSGLFGFDYKLEAYTPAAKRRYGHYVLPILRGTRMIGRLDPKLDRKAGALLVNGLWLEPGVKPSRTLAMALARTLRSFARFVEAERVDIVKTEPASLKTDLSRAL